MMPHIVTSTLYIIFLPRQILATVAYFHTLSFNIIFWLVPCLNRTTLHVREKLPLLVKMRQVTNYVYQIMKYVMCEIFFDSPCIKFCGTKLLASSSPFFSLHLKLHVHVHYYFVPLIKHPGLYH